MKTSGSECEKTIFKGIYRKSDMRQNIRQEGEKLKLVDITMKPPNSFLTLRKTVYDILCLNMQIRHYPNSVHILAFILSDKARFKILVLFCWQTKYKTFFLCFYYVFKNKIVRLWMNKLLSTNLQNIDRNTSGKFCVWVTEMKMYVKVSEKDICFKIHKKLFYTKK